LLSAAIPSGGEFGQTAWDIFSEVRAFHSSFRGIYSFDSTVFEYHLWISLLHFPDIGPVFRDSGMLFALLKGIACEIRNHKINFLSQGKEPSR
jgi:hypothetical protein